MWRGIRLAQGLYRQPGRDCGWKPSGTLFVVVRFGYIKCEKMLARVKACAVIGLEGVVVDVEVDTGRGLPKIIIVGLPDAAVKESRDRVRAALENSGFKFPRGYFTINLAPADIKKEGAALDLPIAIGILAASGFIRQDNLNDYIIL